MKALLAILFTVSAGSIASAANIPDKLSNQTTQVEDRSTSASPIENAVDNNTSEPLEESVDEDDTSKEKVYHRLASMYFSFILKQRYLSQYLIFEQLRLEIETPPPKIP